MLEVSNGNFFYGNRQILKDINFKLKKSEIISILGANGVGKTTLIKCLCGVYKLNSGKISLLGRDISSYSKKELSRIIGYVPQAKSTRVPLSVLDMVVLGRNPYISEFDSPDKEDYQLAESTIEKLGIENLADRSCNTLSGGELQIVMIARALVSKPKLLLLDEPETGLDFKNQLRIIELIEELKKEGLSVIINTHNPNNALRISQMCLLLNKDGNNIFDETSKSLNKENIRKTFGVNVQLNEFIYNDKKYKNMFAIDIVD